MQRWPATIERIGARFDGRDQAVAAMRELRQRFGLGSGDVDVRDLGSTAYERPASGTLLAGRFPAHAAEGIVRLLTARGGTILERRAEPDLMPVLGVVATLDPPPETGGRRFRRSRP